MPRRLLKRFSLAEKFLTRAGVLQPDLHTLLHSSNPTAPLGNRIEWLEGLIGWVRIPTSPDKESRNTHQFQSARIRFLFMILERHPDLKLRLSQTVGSILLETESLMLFSQLGLSREHGFFAEAADRITRKWIPTPFNENDLSELFIKLFKSESDADWIESLDEASALKLQDALFTDPKLSEQVRANFEASIENALIVLAAQIAANGLSPEIRSRARVAKIQSSAFFELAQQISKDRGAFLLTLGRCREEVRAALSHLDEYGVSVAIVYRLEVLEQAIARCEKLVGLLGSGGLNVWKGLIADLIRSRFKSVEVRGLIADNLDLLARKIVERTGESGEHYITRNKSEYLSMLRSASGGGALTTFTTVLKYWIIHAHLPMFIEGIFAWFNYAGSFLLMQGFGFTLATKQPSMTAPALAGKLTNLIKRSQLVDFVNEIAQMTRSQFAAAVGNVGVVIPCSILFDLIWLKATGAHVFTTEYAETTLASIHPFKSLVIPMAALTGCILWVSSIAAGWMENWIVYRRIPDAILQNQIIKRVFGPGANKKIENWLTHNIAGVAGNVSLGFLLSFTPIFGKFFGLPLSAPHVTLTTGAVTFSVCSLGLKDVDPYQLTWACIGIAIIGSLNFGVSFALALSTAVRARHIHRKWLVFLAGTFWVKFRTQPFSFIFPSKEKPVLEQPANTIDPQ